jgi:MYXO-CTERM domain-containing protein
MPGDTVAIELFLQSAVQVSDIRTSFTLGPEIRVATDESGRPRCFVNPDINKESTVFDLRCGSDGVCLLRGHVFAIDNVDPIADGSMLYTCDIAIGPDAAAGTYPLTCASANASDGDHNPMSTGCVDGGVEVLAAPTVVPTPTDTPSPTAPIATATANATPTPVLTATKTALHRRAADGGCQVAAPGAMSWGWLLAMGAAGLWLRRRSEANGTERDGRS